MLHLGSEDASHEIRAPCSTFPLAQGRLNLGPVRVRSHGDEEVGFPESPHYGHGVEVMLVKSAGSSRKGRRQDDLPADSRVALLKSVAVDGVVEALVRFRPNVALVLRVPRQTVAFCSAPSVAEPCLEKQACRMRQ
eukprot:3296830-Pyramimonas_sp.AAC.5